MHYIIIFGEKLTQLDFVLYIVMPSSIVLIILTYIGFNIRLISLSFDYDLFLGKSQSKIEEKLEKTINEE